MARVLGQINIEQQGGRVLGQVPQQAQEKTGLEKTAGVLDTIFGGGKVGEAIGTEIARGTFGKTLQKFAVGRELSGEEEALVGQGPTKGQIAGSALQSASLFVPVGRLATGIARGAVSLGVGKVAANLAGGVLSGAGAGATFGLGSGLSQVQSQDELLKTTTSGALVGGAIPLVGTAIGATSKFLGRALKGTGKSLYNTTFDATQRESEALLGYKANYPLSERISAVLAGKNLKEPITRADTAFRKGIKGTETMVGVQAKRLADGLYKKTILPALQKSKEVVTKDDLFSPIIKRIQNTLDPVRKQSFQDAFDFIQDAYKNVDNLDLVTANRIKSELDKFTPTKIFNGKEIANEYRTLANDMANAIREKTYKSIGKEAKLKYLDLSNLIKLEQVGVKAISEAGFKGGSGGFITSMWNMATTPIKTVGGRTLYRVGDAFEFVGDKGIKFFGDFLSKKGIRKPRTMGDRLLQK